MKKQFESDRISPVDLHQIPVLQNVEVRDSLHLRPLAETDAPRILEILAADPNIRQRVSIAEAMKTNVDVCREIETAREDPGLIRYAILHSGNPIGLISFWSDDGVAFGTPPAWNDYGFGYFLDKDFRGQGIITAAMSRIMDIATHNLPVHQFIAFCEQDNPKSAAVLRRLGFQPTGQLFGELKHGWREEKYIKPIVKAQ